MKNKGYLTLIIFYLIYSISQGVLLPFVNIYYAKIGLSGTQIGQIGSLALLATMVILPICGILTDRIKKNKLIIVLSILLTMVATYVWQFQSEYVLILIFAVLMSVTRGVTMPLCDSISLLFCKAHNKDYGFLRAMSSLGYVIGSIVIVKIAEQLGFESPLISVYLIVLGVALLVGSFYPKAKQEKTANNSLLSDLKVLLKNKSFLFILFLAAFNNVPFESASAYIGNHLISTFHLESSAMSTYLIFATIPEIVFIMIISKLFKKFGYRNLFLLANITQIIRGVVYATTSNYTLFLIMSVVQMIMVGVASVGNFSYINKVTPQRLTTSAMSIYSSFVMIVTAIYTQLFGIIYDQWGTRYIFLVMSLMTLVGFIVIFKTNNFKKMSLTPTD